MQYDDTSRAVHNGVHRSPVASTFASSVAATCAQIDALDAEIASLERDLAVLPDVLRLLAGPPVLWLLIGREGIDRPGTLGTIVGQQVVTVVRRDRTALLIVGLAMRLLGVAIGVGAWMLLQGGSL